MTDTDVDKFVRAKSEYFSGTLEDLSTRKGRNQVPSYYQLIIAMLLTQIGSMLIAIYYEIKEGRLDSNIE
jgi:hypothetical protein